MARELKKARHARAGSLVQSAAGNTKALIQSVDRIKGFFKIHLSILKILKSKGFSIAPRRLPPVDSLYRRRRFRRQLHRSLQLRHHFRNGAFKLRVLPRNH